jgi:23S rRNA (uracil1939-C5)-methyltransferase
LVLFFKKELLPSGPSFLSLSANITRLDSDGVTAEGMHVPRTLPGEEIIATKQTAHRAVCDEVLVASMDRVTPVCPHFALCGGCAVQHMSDTAYEVWKRGLVASALSRAGFDASVLGPLVRTAPGTRRRMDFGARRVPGGVVLGLHQAHGGALVDIQVCPVLHPDLVRLLEPLRGLLRSLNGLRASCDVVVNLLAGGPDLLLRLDAEPNATDRAKLAVFAQAHGILRIACAVGKGTPETAAQLGAPEICFAGVTVNPPCGAFLQASTAGEAAIVSAVLDGLPLKLTGRARIVELFAGIGTLSFPLAERARVCAFEGDSGALAALRRAAGGTRVEAVQRDLMRQPLQPAELAGAAAVVLDPTYAGGGAQMAPLAQSGVPVIIYVSCNPGALARDAVVLRDRNYTITKATAIDQFLWSAGVESVCVFEKRSKEAVL